MNLGQNKFYIGLGAVLLLGSLIFGYLLWQTSDAFSEAEGKYNEQVAELDRLQKLELYPKAENQKILEEQMASAHEAAIMLHRKLLPMSFPLEPLSPEQFQDKLDAAVKKSMEKAAAAGVNLSDKFYLGFAEYRTATPRPEAAAALGRQLKCIALAVDTMIEKQVASIDKITRTPLVEELDASREPVAAPTPKPRSKSAPLLSSYPFEIQFSSEQRGFENVLNELSANEQQFFIIRPVMIKNQSEKAPKKIDPNAATEAAKTAAAGAPLKNDKLRYVLGSEKLNVSLRFDAVVFASNLPK